MKKNKEDLNLESSDYIFFCLKNRVILLNYALFLIIIGNKVLSYIEEWNLLKGNKVPNYKKYYLSYLNLLIEEEFSKIKVLENIFYSKSLFIFNIPQKNHFCIGFFENFENFNKHVKEIVKKHHKKIIKSNLSFDKKSSLYKNIKVIELSGEEEEFLKKHLKN